MGNLWKCLWYLIVTGIISFLIGRIVPKRWFNPLMFPYRCYRFEMNGQIYNKLKVRKWQNKVPDMSRILPKAMPPKNLSGDYTERLPRMIQETCVAELVHTLLCFTGLYCLKLWPGFGGAVVAVINIAVFNLPFVIIQRYNRPRLMSLYDRLLQNKEASEERGI